MGFFERFHSHFNAMKRKKKVIEIFIEKIFIEKATVKELILKTKKD